MATAAKFSYYEVLNVDMRAEPFVIQAAYRALMLKYHPDKFDGEPETGERKSREINEAYEVLSDPTRRAEYDRELGRAKPRRSAGSSSRSGGSAAQWPRPTPAAPEQPEISVDSALGSARAHNIISGATLLLAVVVGAVWWHRIASPAPMAASAAPAAPSAAESATPDTIASDDARTAPLPSAAAEIQVARVRSNGSTLTFSDQDGSEHSLTLESAVRDATISPKADAIAVGLAGDGSASDRLAVVDPATGTSKDLGDLSASSADAEPISVSRVRYSLDGGFLYAEVSSSLGSRGIVQVNLTTGRKRLVIDGSALRVVRDGPWRGFLLVSRRGESPEGGGNDAFYLVRPDGHVQMMVPGSDAGDGDAAVDEWLAAEGWTAS